jgi:hypothetical protein
MCESVAHITLIICNCRGCKKYPRTTKYTDTWDSQLQTAGLRKKGGCQYWSVQKSSDMRKLQQKRDRKKRPKKVTKKK